MQTYSLAPATVKPELKPISDPLAEMQANIDDLVARMSAALDEIAEAAVPGTVINCGEWTLETMTWRTIPMSWAMRSTIAALVRGR